MENGKSNDSIKWDKVYLIGDEHIDNQHHQLFELLNNFIISCEKSADISVIKGTLDFLVNYTIQHFNDEETLQIKCNYPEYEKHKQMHEDFKVSVVDLVQRFFGSESLSELSTDIKKVIIKWLIHHIIYEDKKIGVYLRRLG
ncbi:MAG: hemerythrin family protein [Treponema sp.]|nr:hemerythrin family protein [Treponema sp.]